MEFLLIMAGAGSFLLFGILCVAQPKKRGEEWFSMEGGFFWVRVIGVVMVGIGVFLVSLGIRT